ncbi:hypothetical protein [Sphingobium cupriresistens]|uniref:hypothetical protein n=2 Tax=Sphingobium TaxID=165695 RepID=UPI003BAE09B6
MILKLGAIAAVSALGLSVYAFQSAPEVGSGAASAAAPATVPTGVDAKAPRMIPARLLDCTLGKISNFDTQREQDPSEYTYSSRHKFSLFLPETPVRTAPPPDATAPPEPVNPQTRIVADPDGIARDAEAHAFDRVVDFWPQRVEMTKPISEVAVKLVVIDGIAPNQSTATMFLTSANDAVTFDLKNLYYGQCGVKLGNQAQAAASAAL